jgi:hypothetical protein
MCKLNAKSCAKFACVNAPLNKSFIKILQNIDQDLTSSCLIVLECMQC